MEQFVELLKQINVAQIFVIFAGIWFSYKRLDVKIGKLDVKIDQVDQKLSAKIDQVDQKLSARIEKLDETLSARIEGLSNKVEDIDRRLWRIEGGLVGRAISLGE